MSQNFGQVIRKDQVKTAGSCRLAHNAIYANQQRNGPAMKPGADPSHSPQVQIIETKQQGTVLEFTCSCGTKTYIQCDFNLEK